MDKVRFDYLKKKCERAECLLDTATANLAIELQPYFKQEVSVFYQPSDGFCVLVDGTEDYVFNPNIPIDEVLKNITADCQHYIKLI